MEMRQMRTGVEEVMGNEVVAQSNLLRGPGVRSAGQEVFLAMGERGIWGLSRLSWDTASCPPPPRHRQARSACRRAAPHQARLRGEPPTEARGAEAGQRDGRRKEEGSRRVGRGGSP